MWDSTDQIVVVGTGAFATAMTAALAEAARAPAAVTLVGRDKGVGADLAAQLTTPCVRVRFHGLNTFSSQEFASLFTVVRPRLVVVCASEQSPYQQVRYSPRWERIRAAAEFGFTAPLQATFAIRAARALASVDMSDTPLVNACYPDFVNPLMRLLGLQVLCGLGNVESLTAALDEILAPRTGQPLRMVAHHRHLKGAFTTGQEARIWLGDEELSSAQGLLGQVRRLPRRHLNDLGARQAGRLLARLLDGETVQANLPGVSGPGGFPVRVSTAECELDLPSGAHLAELYAWQQRHALAEGVAVLPQGEIAFTGRSASGLLELGIVDQPVMHVTRWDRLRDRMIDARTGLLAHQAATGGARC
jgi:hypothetical protein